MEHSTIQGCTSVKQGLSNPKGETPSKHDLPWDQHPSPKMAHYRTRYQSNTSSSTAIHYPSVLMQGTPLTLCELSYHVTNATPMYANVVYELQFSSLTYMWGSSTNLHEIRSSTQVCQAKYATSKVFVT